MRSLPVYVLVSLIFLFLTPHRSSAKEKKEGEPLPPTGSMLILPMGPSVNAVMLPEPSTEVSVIMAQLPTVEELVSLTPSAVVESVGSRPLVDQEGLEPLPPVVEEPVLDVAAVDLTKSPPFLDQEISELPPVSVYRPRVEQLYSEQTVLSATRSLQHRSRVTNNVTVITREELDRWPVGDLDEALGMINGIVVQDDGHLGQVATAQIHGSKPREVRVMIDGITFNATTTGGIADLSQIPLDLVEKIEIIKGASSSVWGSSMGGVINIITRPVGESWIPKGSISTSFGEFRTRRQRGEVSGRVGPVRYYAFGTYVDSGGFRPHGDTLEKKAYLKAEIPITEAIDLKGSFGYSGTNNSEFNLSRFGVRFDRKVYSRYGRAGLTLDLNEDAYAEVFYKISERSFRRDLDLLSPPINVRFLKARSLIHEVSAQSSWNIKENQTLVIGSDIGVDVLSSAVFQLGTTLLSGQEKSTRHAYYVNYQLSWKRFDVTLGSRIDSTNSYGKHFSPSAGVVFDLPFWDGLLRANVSKAFNAPSLVDRFVSVGRIVANPDLKAETAIVYNLGGEINPVPWFHASSTFFQTFIDDSIITRVRSDGLIQSVNVDSERRTGFEAEVKLDPWLGISPSYGATYVKSVKPGGGPLQGRPRFTQDIKVNFAQELAGFHFNAHLAGRYMDLVTGFGPTDPIDQAFIFDSKIILTFPKILYGKISLVLEGENLFNEDFSFDGGIDPNPQRNFEAGIKFTV